MGWLQSLKAAFVSGVQQDPVIQAFKKHIENAPLTALFTVANRVAVSPEAGRGQPILVGYSEASILVADTPDHKSYVAMVAKRAGGDDYNVLSIKNLARPQDKIHPMDRIEARHIAVGAKTCVLGLSKS